MPVVSRFPPQNHLAKTHSKYETTTANLAAYEKRRRARRTTGAIPVLNRRVWVESESDTLEWDDDDDLNDTTTDTLLKRFRGGGAMNGLLETAAEIAKRALRNPKHREHGASPVASSSSAASTRLISTTGTTAVVVPSPSSVTATLPPSSSPAPAPSSSAPAASSSATSAAPTSIQSAAAGAAKTGGNALTDYGGTRESLCSFAFVVLDTDGN